MNYATKWRVLVFLQPTKSANNGGCDLCRLIFVHGLRYLILSKTFEIGVSATGKQAAEAGNMQYAPICCPGHLDCSALCLTMIGRCTPCVGLFKYYVAKRYNAFEIAQYAQICCLGHLVWPWLTMFRVAHVSCLSQANADIRWRSVCDTDCG